ncbi:hypothetical protein HGA64_05245 [Candidatus Falkowbacteria bacterium]|nr:hypothetical protein [Candidatus Falkowbacteria bacterium]
MLNPITIFKRSRQRKQVIKFSNDLAFHMHSIATYLLRTNMSINAADCIREAVSMLETWERVSQNLFSHKSTGLMLEVKPNTNLLLVTFSILDIELGDKLKDWPQAKRNALINECHYLVKDYFTQNKVNDRLNIIA